MFYLNRETELNTVLSQKRVKPMCIPLEQMELQNRPIACLLIVAWLCNLIDTIATVYLTNLGYIEANLLMSCLLAQPVIFVLVKMILMTGLLLFLWLKRTDKHAQPLTTIAAIVYGAIAVYYAWFFHAVL